jgi:putative phosphoribosyl transferase
MALPYKDRIDAAGVLADRLREYEDSSDILVLGLPRRGVPVADVIARSLGAPWDILIVRKLGMPDQEELAIGAIASGGVRVLNRPLARRVPEDVVEKEVKLESRELQRREEAYRGDKPHPEIAGRCVILVDDGLATGATMRAAVRAIRKQNPREVVVAVPVAPPEAVESIREVADHVVCPATPANFSAVGQCYEDFSETTDEEVRERMEHAEERFS